MLSKCTVYLKTEVPFQKEICSPHVFPNQTSFLPHRPLFYMQLQWMWKTWGWVNSDRVFIYGWTVPLICSVTLSRNTCLNQKRHCVWWYLTFLHWEIFVLPLYFQLVVGGTGCCSVVLPFNAELTGKVVQPAEQHRRGRFAPEKTRLGRATAQNAERGPQWSPSPARHLPLFSHSSA